MSFLPSRSLPRMRWWVVEGALVVLVNLALEGVVVVVAQQQPPLQGQGVDPLAAKVAEEQVDVFTTVELVKLLNLNEQDYTFQALLNFDLTWTDPRAKAVWTVINSGLNSSMQQLNESQVACASLIGGDESAANVSALSSPECQKAQQQAPTCSKYCETYGQSTDNRYLCCDNVWLPDIELRNLEDISQDRVVSDFIWNIDLPGLGADMVHRNTLVLGRFFTALDFRRYPFDRQRLQIFVDANIWSYWFLPPFRIVPSGVFRRLDVLFQKGPGRNGSVDSKSRDQLAGWNIVNATFSCAEIPEDTDEATLTTRPISEQTQSFDPDDAFGGDYNGGLINQANYVSRTCAFVIEVERLSSTAVAQSIVPVAFIATLAFMVFATEPDNLDLRLSTEVTLFLALTAVQFIFSAVLPVASYLTAFDVFIILSYSLIVVIILENCLVAYICTRKEHLERTAQRLGDMATSYSLHEQDSVETQKLKGEDEVDGKGRDEGAGEKAAEHASERAEGAKSTLPESERSGAFSIVSSHVADINQTLAENPGNAYRLACTIDLWFAVVLMVVYLVLAIINFTVGFW